MQRLDVRNTPGEVGSISNLVADLPDGRKLLVLSGIAMTNWEVDTDETQFGETHVYLGFYGNKNEALQWSALVGLASIANDETGFVFGVDTVEVKLDDDTDELKLIFKPSLMGEPSAMHRVSYQVVVTMVTITAHIRGTIVWLKQNFEPPNLDVSTIDPELEIVANLYESTPPPGSGRLAGGLTPIKIGHILSVQKMRDIYTAKYEIVGPPMGVELKVTVKPSEKFKAPPGSALTVARTGPDVFTLKATSPDLNDLHFGIGVLSGPR